MSVLGFDVAAEVSVSGGRLDATLELDDKVYIMEFKYADCPQDATVEKKRKLFDKTLDEGIKQIMNKGYGKKYESGRKEVINIAFAFLGRDEIEFRVS
jgi:hypothetical protein